MNGIKKALTAILGLVAVAACLATVGIIGYTLSDGKKSEKSSATESARAASSGNDGLQILAKTGNADFPDDVDVLVYMPVPGANPTAENAASASENGSESYEEELLSVPLGYNPELSDNEPATAKSLRSVSIDPNHVHKYHPEVIKKPSCYEAGRIKYECSCGDYYYADQISTGHVPGEWTIVKQATADEEGEKIKKCIYCDEVVAKETIPQLTSSSGDPHAVPTPRHEHLYVANTEREATCTLAGLRKLTCSCGDFYTESIPAIGHVASDWTVVEEPTLTHFGTEQRLCSVCGALLDTRVLLPVTPSPAASPSSEASASPEASAAPATSGTPAATKAPTPSAVPTPTPHVHAYTSYVVTPATCTEQGIRSYVCSCGSSYAESIPVDSNNHKFQATFVEPTDTQQGYTVYTCTRCNYSYKDNYLLPLTNRVNPNASPAAEASAEP